MSLETRAASQRDAAALLRNARFELMPFDSFDDELAHLPDDATVAVTTSPQLGVDRTVERAVRAADAGYEVSPHIAARYVRDRSHLAEIADLLIDAGVTDIFVPGGDREEPEGEFTSALDLLTALEEMSYSFEEVGITGYPEGHAFLDDDTLVEAMAAKAPYATYAVTQLCYDPSAVVEWIEAVRDRGIDLPVAVGVPGVMGYQRLLEISRKVGVGDSIRFLTKTTGVVEFVRQLLDSRGRYTPDDLVDGLAAAVDDGECEVHSLHFYTFNQTDALESWRRDRLAD